MSEQRHAPLAVHPLQVEDGGELLKRGQIVRRTKVLVLVVLVLLALGAGRTLYSRAQAAQSLQASTNERQRNYVKTTLARVSESGQTLSLPGTLQGFAQSPIYARVGGYIKSWTKDIGSAVRRGELLAEIETPETDQQLAQAVAARRQAESSLELAKSTAVRWEALRKKDVVSQQDLDERRSAVTQSQANLAATEANVGRLRQLEDFKRVLAPFSGVITRRNVDVGDLIDSSRLLFTLSQTDPLRVYVNIPQAYAQLVKLGQKVTVSQAELQGQRFAGQLVRTSAAIDTTTRTMQLEVALPNPEGILMPGAYVRVELSLPASKSLVAPTNTLLFRAQGTMVAVVDAQGRVSLRRVSVGRNYGVDFEVLEGLTETDRVVINPPDWIADGQTVVANPAKGGK